MNLTERILTENDCWKAGRTIKPVGIMVHSMGVAQPNAEVFLKSWNKPGVEKCVHAFVARDAVIQTLPWNWRGWHAGGKANNTHISFEILEPAGHTYKGGTMIGYDTAKNAAYFADVYRNAVELSAMLCKQYGIDPDTGIVDHAEGYQLGISSNHGDVGHWFPKHGKSMDTFRADVKKLLKGEDEMDQETLRKIIGETFRELFQQAFDQAAERRRTEENAASPSAWAVEDWQRAVEQGVFDGTRPKAPLTREQAAVLLYRLGWQGNQEKEK
mgnify:FL=1